MAPGPKATISHDPDSGKCNYDDRLAIDMKALDHLLRRKRNATRVSTENYQF